MALRKKSGNIFAGSLLNVDGQGIYTVKKFQLVLNKSKKSLVLEPTLTPTPTLPIITGFPNTPTPTPTIEPTPTPTPTPLPINPTIVAFGYVTNSFANIGGYSLDYSGNSWTTGYTSNTPYSPNLYKGLFYRSGNGVATDGTLWVAGGEYWPQPGFEQYEFSLGYSYDGISWTGITDSVTLGSPQMLCIAYGYDDMSNPLWVVGMESNGVGNGIIYTSFDGINWNWASGTILNSPKPKGVYFGKENGTSPLWIMVGQGIPNNFASSSDGQNWNTGTIGLNSENFNCIAYSELTNIWIAGCDDAGRGTIYTSNDGINFTQSATPPTFTFCWGVAFSSSVGANNRWVAVGDDNIHYSDDSGVSWTPSSNGDTILGKGHSVCWNGQYFIVVGESVPGHETIAYSPDGDFWYESNSDGNIFSYGLTIASIPGPDMYPPR